MPTDTPTREHLVSLIRESEDAPARIHAIASLAEHYSDAITKSLLIDLSLDEDKAVAAQAGTSLDQHFGPVTTQDHRNELSRRLLTVLSRPHENTIDRRRTALEGLVEGFPDAVTRALLIDLAQGDPEPEIRQLAIDSLHQHFPGDPSPL